MEELEDSFETDTSVLHIEADFCQCPECDKLIKSYIQIIDVDKYVNALNDWD